MNANLAYWSAALANMVLVVALAVRGVGRIRRDQVPCHRRAMLGSASLVGLFVLSYVVKLGVLGHEDRSVWTRADLAVLYFHETCIATMLLGGAAAGSLAFRVRRSRRVTGDPAAPPAPAALLRWHRRMGWTALVGAGLGLLSAAVVLLGMVRRAGLA